MRVTRDEHSGQMLSRIMEVPVELDARVRPVIRRWGGSFNMTGGDVSQVTRWDSDPVWV